VSDRVTANLPARDLDATAEFYAGLGFVPSFKDQGWMILRRGPLEIEFFPWPEIDPWTSIASCCIRISEVDALHEAFAKVGLPSKGIPRLTSPIDQPWGMREFALVDLNGNLLRCMRPSDPTP
jgi:catechol 2,3-dioxygenase-like lactoylglutathione lyase family enzyme